MFHLPFHIPESTHKVRFKDSLVTMGSCFADHMGARLEAYKFHVQSNPFGIVYNPHSIFKSLRLSLADGLNPDHYVKHRDIYYHWDAHSTVSGTKLIPFQDDLQAKSRLLRASLGSSNWLLLSLGTSFAYRHKSTNRIVANCHKVPQTNFEKILLSSEEMVAEYRQTLRLLRSINPKIQVILTVSPVRHIRDGLSENNLSKGILLQAVHQMVNEDPNTHYFPAYELMIDVLRDYRFYKSDMIHPNEQAIDYIWNQFTQTYLDTDAREFMAKWSKIRHALNHRSFHPTSKDHQQFLEQTLKQLHAISDKVDVSNEIEDLESQLQP